MLEKVVTKLWQGRFVSVRDYEVDKAIARNGMIIHFQDKTMLVTREELLKIKGEISSDTAIHKSKTGGQNYRLVDIPWERNEPIASSQKELFDV